MVPQPRAAREVLAAQPQIAGVQVFGDRLHVWMPDSDPRAAEAKLRTVVSSTNVEPATIRPILPSLEDVFISEVLNWNPS